jgi:hypothetical protein
MAADECDRAPGKVTTEDADAHSSLFGAREDLSPSPITTRQSLHRRNDLAIPTSLRKSVTACPTVPKV